MSKKKAIEICENLKQTISKMKSQTLMYNKNEMFEVPRVKKKF